MHGGEIPGNGIGLALAGMRPVCEIMFGDFLTLAADQIVNHASKFKWMYNDQVTVPTIIRTPMGGRRGYGATHSQCLEKHFLGVPGTVVLALHHRFDPHRLYESLFAGLDCPASSALTRERLKWNPVGPALIPDLEYLYEEMQKAALRSVDGYLGSCVSPNPRFHSIFPVDVT